MKKFLADLQDPDDLFSVSINNGGAPSMKSVLFTKVVEKGQMTNMIRFHFLQKKDFQYAYKETQFMALHVLASLEKKPAIRIEDGQPERFPLHASAGFSSFTKVALQILRSDVFKMGKPTQGKKAFERKAILENIRSIFLVKATAAFWEKIGLDLKKFEYEFIIANKSIDMKPRSDYTREVEELDKLVVSEIDFTGQRKRTRNHSGRIRLLFSGPSQQLATRSIP